MEPLAGKGRVRVFARLRPLGASEAIAPLDVDTSCGVIRVRSGSSCLGGGLPHQLHRAGTASLEVAKHPGNESSPLHGSCGRESLDAPPPSPEKASHADSRHFSFDAVFDGDATQGQVFTAVGMPVLKDAMNGINGTILAYGQTGSGKTHSLLNSGCERTEEAGLLPQLVVGMYLHAAQDINSVFEIEAAAMQVYNEQVDDLLHPETERGVGLNLAVQNGGVVSGLTWVQCEKPEDLLECFTKARSSLIYAETRMNKASSRSHAVFQIRIRKRSRASSEDAEAVVATKDRLLETRQMACTHAKLTIVDLAGTERVKRSGSEGTQFREATAINKSLLAFGNVVSALAARRPHVNFRDSRLTRILDGSIGGNSKTSLLVCLSPTTDSLHETITSLEFAARAIRVEVDAKVNCGVVEVSAQALMRDIGGHVANAVAATLRAELDELRQAAAHEADLRRDESAAKCAALEQQAERRLQEAEVASQAALQAMRVRLYAAEKEAAEARASFSQESERASFEASCRRSAEARAQALTEEVSKGITSAELLRQEHDAAIDRANFAEEHAASESRSRHAAESRIEVLMSEVAQWKSHAEALAADIETLRSERDAAVDRAVVAEASLEEELEAMMAEIEASDERASQLQRDIDKRMAEERQEAAAKLKAAYAQIADFEARLKITTSCSRRCGA